MKSSHDRECLIRRIFGRSVPALWCPALTHYGPDRAIDGARMEKHLGHMRGWVQSFLIPGSTGDGWELSDAESREVLDIGLACADKLGLRLLVGVLRTNADEARQCVTRTLERLRDRTGAASDEEALRRARVCGFTVCPPKGEGMSQEQIRRALAAILELGAPVALYQLPQITQNEMTPETLVSLAEDYPNFCLFKDSSGADRVALSEKDLGRVCLLRGAERDYARWVSEEGGVCNGFLLSTANCFARELSQMIAAIFQGRAEEAQELSDRLSSVIGEVFDLVAELPDGNAFTNANKAMDHFFAHGPDAAELPPPRLHAGSSLPAAIIRATGQALRRHDLMPDAGYLLESTAT